MIPKTMEECSRETLPSPEVRQPKGSGRLSPGSTTPRTTRSGSSSSCLTLSPALPVRIAGSDEAVRRRRRTSLQPILMSHILLPYTARHWICKGLQSEICLVNC